ncbi:helix-turn-helix domain-containing protein [Haloechinothrix alba]|nr:helix-turn-helix transcriptional regulator [Haloechinothrix alba]
MQLDELIKKKKAESGLSFAAMADRARRSGYDINRATIHALTKNPMHEWPRVDTINGLAVALDVSPTDVLDSAAESLGVKLDRSPTDSYRVRSWMALTGDRSDDEVDKLLEVARSVAAALDAQREDHPDAPGN